MEYFDQYVHPINDSSFMLLINDISNIAELNKTIIVNNDKINYVVPSLQYLFLSNKTYFIKFYIKCHDNIVQHINLYSALQDNDETINEELISNFNINRANNSDDYQFCTTIFSPLFESNMLIWDLEERNNINQSFSITIDKVEIYQLQPIPFFEHFQDNCERIITKIAIQGPPGTYFSLNRGKGQIPIQGIYETKYNIPIQSVYIASTDSYIIDYTYKTLTEEQGG